MRPDNKTMLPLQELETLAKSEAIDKQLAIMHIIMP